MSDCVYTAYEDYMNYLKSYIPTYSRLNYDAVRRLAGHRKCDPTYIGIIPTMMDVMIRLNPLPIIMVVECDEWFGVVTWWTGASKLEQGVMKYYTTLRHRKITPGIGIYCGLYNRHAFFWDKDSLPEGDYYVMSIKFIVY